MKRVLFAFFAALVLLFQARGQSLPAFDIYGYPHRFGPKSVQYFKANGFKYANLLTHSSIFDHDPNKFSPRKVNEFLKKTYPDANASGNLVIDWETEIFDNLKEYPVADLHFERAESEFIKLIDHIKKSRPNIKVGIYGIPFKGWKDTQISAGNSPGKYNNILSKTDFIAPSYYIMYADEEVGHQRNKQYLRDNLDVALDYGKRLQKPVIPFVWQKIHDYNKLYGREIIQKDTFVDYIRCIATYSPNNYKVSGIIWWDEYRENYRLGDLSGVGNHLEGKLIGSDKSEKYDNLMLDYAKAIVQMLRSSRIVSFPASTSDSKGQ